MKTLIIISCVKKKIWSKNPCAGPIKASEAYISNYFVANKRFALVSKCDWMILSAKYGFLYPDDEIYNYDMTFKSKSYISDEVLSQQVKEKNLHAYSKIIVLGGKAYRDRVQKVFANTNIRIVFPITGIVSLPANIREVSNLTDKLLASGNIDDICS